MSSALQRTFNHLVTANSVLLGDPAPLPTHPAPSSNHPAPPPLPSDTSIKIAQGRTLTSRVLLHAVFRYSRDGKVLKYGRQSWRCVKRCKCPGRLYTLNETFQSLGKPHSHPADSNAAEVRSRVKYLASKITTSNQ